MKEKKREREWQRMIFMLGDRSCASNLRNRIFIVIEHKPISLIIQAYTFVRLRFVNEVIKTIGTDVHSALRIRGQ